MSFTIEGYEFLGPISSADEVVDGSGVYVVLDEQPGLLMPQYRMLDCGESEHMQQRLKSHERSYCWYLNSQGRVGFAVHFAGERERMDIERGIRGRYNLPCGIL